MEGEEMRQHGRPPQQRQHSLQPRSDRPSMQRLALVLKKKMKLMLMMMMMMMTWRKLLPVSPKEWRSFGLGWHCAEQLLRHEVQAGGNFPRVPPQYSKFGDWHCVSGHCEG